MRKLFLIMGLILLTGTVSAQDGLKGVWFAGGEFSYGSDTDKNGVKTKSTMVLPVVGTFVSPSVAVGAGIGYIGEKESQTGLETISGNKDISKSNSFVFKPLVRKYWNITGGLYFYGQAALPLIFGNVKDYSSGQEAKLNTTSVGLELSPGFDFVINKWLTIETSFTIFSAGFNTLKPKNGDSTTNWNIGAKPFNTISDRKIGDLQVGVKFLF